MAVWFRPDNMGPEFFEAEPYRRLHEAAARHNVIFKVGRSNITRGWTYNAEIFFVEGTGRPYPDAPQIEQKRYRPNGAGMGADPIQALIDGCRLAQLKSPDVLMAILEAEAWLLVRAARKISERARIEAAIDAALDDLTALLRSVNVPAPAPAGQSAIPQARGEDDDL